MIFRRRARKDRESSLYMLEGVYRSDYFVSDEEGAFSIWTKKVPSAYSGDCGRFEKDNIRGKDNLYDIVVPMNLLESAGRDCRVVGGGSAAGLYIIVPVETADGRKFNMFVNGDTIEGLSQWQEGWIAFDEFLNFDDYLIYAQNEGGLEPHDWVAIQTPQLTHVVYEGEMEISLLTKSHLNEWLAENAETTSDSPIVFTSSSGSRLTPTVLERLAPRSDRFCVMDVETTGVYNKDRVVEVAIVTINKQGEIVEKWETLIQPERDIGATEVHGITASMLIQAPCFADVIGDIAERLDGAYLVGHNVSFDIRMLSNEFARHNGRFEASGSYYETSKCYPMKLSEACQHEGIEAAKWHSAMDDASATAELFLRCEPHTMIGSLATRPVSAETATVPSGRALTRANCGEIPEPAETPDRLEAYMSLLEEVLEDGVVTEEERAEMQALQRAMGWSEATTESVHRQYLQKQVDEAIEDGVVDAQEQEELAATIEAFGFGSRIVDRRIRPFKEGEGEQLVVLQQGDRITLTGEHPMMSRDEMQIVLTQRGLTIGSFAKKYTRLLLAADTETESTKAQKCRECGIPILPMQAFGQVRPGIEIAVLVG